MAEASTILVSKTFCRDNAVRSGSPATRLKADGNRAKSLFESSDLAQVRPQSTNVF